MHAKGLFIREPSTNKSENDLHGVHSNWLGATATLLLKINLII